MENTYPAMNLSPDEESYLRHWMYDEWHYRDGAGLTKRLQVEHAARPADLAVLIAAAFPDLREQQRAADGPPPFASARWPWSGSGLNSRVNEARRMLEAAGPQGIDPDSPLLSARRRTHCHALFAAQRLLGGLRQHAR
jgi:hypothetical protein